MNFNTSIKIVSKFTFIFLYIAGLSRRSNISQSHLFDKTELTENIISLLVYIPSNINLYITVLVPRFTIIKTEGSYAKKKPLY